MLRAHKTVILVTHQVQYLTECDSVIILDHGKIAYHDRPGNLKKQLIDIQHE